MFNPVGMFVHLPQGKSLICRTSPEPFSIFTDRGLRVKGFVTQEAYLGSAGSAGSLSDNCRISKGIHERLVSQVSLSAYCHWMEELELL